MLVAGAGTGGTITGLGRKIKEKCPSCKVRRPNKIVESLTFIRKSFKTDEYAKFCIEPVPGCRIFKENVK